MRRRKRKGNKWPVERSHWRMHAMACHTQYGHKWSRERSKKWGDKFCESAVNADECEIIHMRKIILNSHIIWWIFNFSDRNDQKIKYNIRNCMIRNKEQSRKPHCVTVLIHDCKVHFCSHHLKKASRLIKGRKYVCITYYGWHLNRLF